MAAYDLQPLSFTAPTPSNQFLGISFRTPSTDDSNPLHPATSLQVSLENGCHEVFLERLTPRDLAPSEAQPGVYSVRLASATLPRFAKPPNSEADSTIRLHAWRGEKYLGVWEVGTIEGVGLRVE